MDRNTFNKQILILGAHGTACVIDSLVPPEG